MSNDRFTGIKKLFEDNDLIPYVILRNWETLGTHSVDVLVNNRDEFVYQFHLAETKAGYHKKIGTKNVPFGVWDINDGYFPVALAERVLKGRIKDPDLKLYVPYYYDRFVAHLYHAIYHKSEMTAEDQIALSMSPRPRIYEAQISDKQYAHEWLVAQDYGPVKCNDKSVGYFIP